MLLACLQPYTAAEEREMTCRYFKATDGVITRRGDTPQHGAVCRRSAKEANPHP